jgi:hypothetical protein
MIPRDPSVIPASDLGSRIILLLRIANLEYQVNRARLAELSCREDLSCFGLMSSAEGKKGQKQHAKRLSQGKNESESPMDPSVIPTSDQ